MKRRSLKWSENIALSLLLASFLFKGVVFGQVSPDQAAANAANQALGQFGSVDAIRQNASNPLTSQGSPMTTIDGSVSFNAQMTCPSPSCSLVYTRHLEAT